MQEKSMEKQREEPMCKEENENNCHAALLKTKIKVQSYNIKINLSS